MSIAIMSRLFKAQIGSPSRKILAIRLADFANDEGCGIWPTVGRLACETELSERTVQRLLQDFVTEGLLIIVKEGGGGRGTSTRYDFDMAAIERLTTKKIDENKGDTTSPLEIDRVTPDTAKGDIDDSLGCHHVTRTVIEPLIKPLSERARENDQESKEDRKANERAFKKAFSSWPTWLTDSEPGAYRAWMSLSIADRQLASEEISRYLDAARATGRKHVCSFAVYLSEKRWEKLTARAEIAADAPAQAAPFGKMWSAGVYASLLVGATRIGNLTSLERQMVAAGTFTAERLLMEKQAKFGFPAVNDLFERAASRRGALIPMSLQPLAEHMAAVKVGSDLWHKWIAAHAERGWPWLPDVGRMEYVYLPEGGPDALNDLQDLLRGIEK